MPPEHLDPEEIYDAATRNDVVRLQADFPDKALETCYYWYLYDHCDYDTTKARFVDGLSKPFQSTILFSATKSSGPKSVNLGVFPAEIWQIITTHLTFEDLSKLRLTNSALADIAAESMVGTIRFDLSFESLERLRSIATHEHLRKSVKTLTFEAGLLAPIGCIHSYSSHYDLDHHNDFKPQPPPEDESTPQAQRLYSRNLAKFNKDLENKYTTYRKSFEAQEQLLNGAKEHLFECIDGFSNLDEINLVTDQCRHLLSERFVERYLRDCAVPLMIDPSQTPWQLQSILRPGIKNLRVRHISPKFFNGQAGRTRKWLQSIFRSLHDLSLYIRHDPSYESPTIASMLETANLPYAIGCAKDLESLLVNFSTILPVGRLSDIVPEGHSFPRLHDLNIESFTATEEEMMKMLGLQPALKSLELSDVTLSTGDWRSLLKRMRNGLNLIFFTSGGTLEDPTVELVTDCYSIEAWQDGEMMSLGVAIDLYVTDGTAYRDIYDDEEEFEECWNPVSRVEDGDFAPYDELVEELGLPEDSDFDDLPDLEGIDDDDDNDTGDDSDDESMHTANEAMSENGDDSKQAEHTNTDMDDMHDLDDVPPSPMDVD